MSHVHDTPPPVGLAPEESPREYAHRAAQRADHKPMWLDDLEDDANAFEATLTAVVLVVVAGYFAAHILFV